MVVQNVTVNNCTPVTIALGMRGTYNTREVVFDLTYLVNVYGSGTAVLLLKRSQDSSAYPAVVSQEGNTLTWTVSEADTYYYGAGECQLMWYTDGGLAKTIVYPTFVTRDISQTTEDPPDTYESWVETLTELGAQTQQNADDAQAASQAIQNMSVEANGVAYDQPAAVEKIVDPDTGAVTLYFDIPAGTPGGGSGGTSDYTELTNKPQINGHTLTSNQTAEQLDLATPSDIPTDAGDIGYDSTETYQAGSVGAELQEQNRHLSDLDGDVADTQGMLAMVEATATASRNYSVGDLLIYDGKLYKVISAIATGATIIVGSNVTQTTVESQIAAGCGGGGGSEKTWKKFRDVTVTLEKPTSNVTYTEGADGITAFSFSVDDNGNSFEYTDIKILAIAKNITGNGMVTVYSGAIKSNVAIMTFRGSGTQGQARVYEFESVLIDGVRFYSGIYATQYANTINNLAPNQMVNNNAYAGNYNNFLNGFVGNSTLFNTINMITVSFDTTTVEGRFIFFGK